MATYVDSAGATRRRARSPIEVTLTWIGATIAGFCLGMPLWPICGLPSLVFVDGIIENADLGALLWSYPAPVVMGLAVIQAIMLNRLLGERGRGTMPRAGWLVATLAGVVLGLAVIGATLMFGRAVGAAAPSAIWAVPLGSILVGCSLGGCQWLVLRRYVPSATRWIVANAGAFAGMGLIAALITYVSGVYDSVDGVLITLEFSSAVLIPLIYGPVTGSTLGRLLATAGDPEPAASARPAGSAFRPN
jgi:hypothetical protein